MKTRILNITSTLYGIGGAERLLLDMSDKFDRDRFSLSYCNLFDIEQGSGEGEFPAALRDKGFEVFNFKGRKIQQLPQTFFKLVRLLRREKFDVVQTHLLQATLVGQSAAQMARVSKRIITRHYTDDTITHSGQIRKLEHYALRSADQVAVVSKAVERDVLNAGVKNDKIKLIYNGIDLAKFDRTLDAAQDMAPDFAKDEYIIGNIANLWIRKGHTDLIKAMPQILARFPQVKLVIIGEGPEEANLKKLTNELNISDKVFFAGFQKNITPFLKRFNLYVHPSHQEPFGIALIEAMAARKCIVATEVGGIPEIVVPEETGWLVPVKNSGKFADAVIKAISETEVTGRMEEAGRRRVEEMFSLDTVVKQYEKLYADITHG